MTITTEVTWADLRQSAESELSDLRDAYDELVALAEDEYGEEWADEPLPLDTDDMDDDETRLWAIRQQAQQVEESAKAIQKNLNNLARLQDEYGDGPFEVKMLTGEETMAIETELRMLADREGVDVEHVQLRRNGLAVDKATVDAPDGVPTEDGSPAPSKAANALTMALWEQVERFNNAGATDFRPGGFGETDPAPTPTDAVSDPPTSADGSPSPSVPTDDA